MTTLQQRLRLVQVTLILEAFSTSFDDLDSLWELALLTQIPCKPSDALQCPWRSNGFGAFSTPPEFLCRRHMTTVMAVLLREGGKMVQGEHCIGMILSKLFVTTS